MSTSFQLHARLAADTFEVAEFSLCRCLLMNDSRYPWLILVPRIDGLRELHDVPKLERGTLFDEIELASQTLQAITSAHKLNVAALGNQVPQLHIHVIARQQHDPAWPGPVWGEGSAVAYDESALQTLMANLKQKFAAGP